MESTDHDHDNTNNYKNYNNNNNNNNAKTINGCEYDIVDNKNKNLQLVHPLK